MRGARLSEAGLRGSSDGTPFGRAVGDEDATGGPTDQASPRPSASQDTQAIEEDRSKSSGRPPLAQARQSAEDAGCTAGPSVDPRHPVKPQRAGRATPPKPSR